MQNYYKTQLLGDPNVPNNVACGQLGVGRAGKTWYGTGTPNARCRSSSFMVDIFGLRATTEGDESPGDCIIYS